MATDETLRWSCEVCIVVQDGEASGACLPAVGLPPMKDRVLLDQYDQCGMWIAADGLRKLRHDCSKSCSTKSHVRV